MSEHAFNTEYAKKYGVICATLIKNFDFWLSKNKANNNHFIAGKYWTYMSINGFCNVFPYLTEKQIRHGLDKLIKEGVIETANHNKHKYDRTLWYTFTLPFATEGKCILQFSQMDNTNMANAFPINVEPIPYTNTDTISDTNTDTKGVSKIDTAKEADEAFNGFWSVYPKKKDKEGARKKFITLFKNKELPDISILIDIVNKNKHTDDWMKDKGQFIPYAETWLNKKRWEDESEVSVIKKEKQSCKKCGAYMSNGKCPRCDDV